MICPNCGMELEEGTPVCPLCEYEFFAMEFNESDFETRQNKIDDNDFGKLDNQFGDENDLYENTGNGFEMSNVGNETVETEFRKNERGNSTTENAFGMNDGGYTTTGLGISVGKNKTDTNQFDKNYVGYGSVETGFDIKENSRESVFPGIGKLNSTGFDINEDAPVDMSGGQNEFRDFSSQSGKNISGKKIVIVSSIFMIIAVVAAGIILFVKNKNSEEKNDSEMQMNMELDEDEYVGDADGPNDMLEEEITDGEDKEVETKESVESETLKETDETTLVVGESDEKITWTTEKDIRTEKYGNSTVTYSFDLVKLPEQYAVTNAKLEQIHQEGKLKGDELFSYTSGLWQQSYTENWVCTYTLKSVSIREKYLSVVWEWEWFAGGSHQWDYKVVNYEISSGNTVTPEQILNMDSNQAKNHIISRTFEYLQKNSMMNAYNECNTGAQRTIADYNTSEFNVYFDDAHTYVCYASEELFELGGMVTVVPLDGEITATSNQAAQDNSNTNSYANITIGNSSYILPNSSSQYLTMADLQGLTPEQCRIARNEIYARHGRKFDDVALQAYFNSCSWYTGTVEPNNFTDSLLNNFEIANKNLIIQYETNMGYR